MLESIRVHELSKQFSLSKQVVPALSGVSFTINSGEIVSIVGPSGGGKSTLLGLIGGLDSPTSGTVVIDGVDISAMNESQLTRVRNEKIGFVFQFYNLISSLTAIENVALPIQFSVRWSGERKTRRYHPMGRARELLTHLGLGERLKHLPAQLSGGEQQRVAIARALANNPPLLLADEPTGNLNTEAGALVMNTIRQVRADFGTTVVIVTHDPTIAKQADRILILVDGLIMQR